MKNTFFRKGFVIFATVLMLTILSSASFLYVYGTEVISGPCGASSEYKLNSDGLLEINGSGNIQDFTPSTIPWKDYYGTIQSVKISDSVTSIGINVFVNLNVLSVKIPPSVINIGAHALGYTYNSDTNTYSKINGFTINGVSGSEAQNYADNNGFTFVANDPSSPSGKCGANLSWQLSSDGVLTVSGNGAMNDFNNSSAAPWAKYSTKTDGFLITSVVITEGVTSVGANAFSNCRELSSISLPAGLLKIGASAFENCSGVSSAIIPESTSSIASKAFSACTALSEITIGSSVKSIGDEAFMLTGIKELNLSSSVTSIGKQAFYGCQDLLSAKIPGVTNIAEKAFAECVSLRSVSVGISLTEIGASAFEGCSLLSDFTFPSGISSISERAFYSCSALTSLTLPNSLQYLGEYSFFGCTGLEAVSIGDGLSIINEGVFEGCHSLTRVEIGNSVTYIGERAFTNCPELHSIEIPVSVKYIAQYSLGYYYFEDPENNISGVYTKYTGFTPEIISYYPSEAENYAKDNNFIFTSLGLILSDNGEVTDSVKWSINTATGVLMISGSGRVPGYLYFDETPWSVYRDYIKTVIYGSGIQNVGDSSFEGCTSLINVTLAGTVTEIGDWAFSGTGIVNLTLPRGIQTINDGAFDSCSELTNVSLPDTLQSIGQFVFRGPNKLKAMYVPESVGYIGSYSIGYQDNNTLVRDFRIKGVKDSVAYNYAKINSIDFSENGHVEITDEESGCSINIIGSDADTKNYKLSFGKVKSTLEPDIFLADNEYALVYEIFLKSLDSVISVEGTALISFPIPENINPIGIKIFYMSDSGNFTEIEFEVENENFIFSYGMLGKFIITNADLNSLRTITVTYQFEDGSDAYPVQIYRGSSGAEFTVKFVEIEGYAPIEKLLSGVISETDINLSFTYKVSELSEKPITGSDSETVTGGNSRGSAKTILIVVEVILIIGIIAAATALIIITRKKKKDINPNTSVSGATKFGADKFSDTIVVPDAPTREINIQSLFADEPEEDTEPSEATRTLNQNDKK